MSDGYIDHAIEDLRSAILDEGPAPDVHRETIRRHAREFPMLWAAIEQLMSHSGGWGHIGRPPIDFISVNRVKARRSS
jgi:hypothetical protein